MRRIVTTAAGLVLAAGLAGAPAGAGELEGAARIVEVHVATGVVVLDDQQFRVVDGTRLADEYGGSLALSQLPSEAAGASGDEVAVYFTASEPGADGLRRLLELQLTGAMPR